MAYGAKAGHLKTEGNSISDLYEEWASSSSELDETPVKLHTRNTIVIKNLKLKRLEADIVDSIDTRNSNKFDKNKVKLKSHQHFKIKHDTGELR